MELRFDDVINLASGISAAAHLSSTVSGVINWAGCDSSAHEKHSAISQFSADTVYSV